MRHPRSWLTKTLLQIPHLYWTLFDRYHWAGYWQSSNCTSKIDTLSLPGDLPGDLAECIPPLWLSLGGSSSSVILGFGVYSFLGLLDTSFILEGSHTVKFYLTTQSIFIALFLSWVGGWIDTCPPSSWRAVGGFQRHDCGIQTELGPMLRAGSPALSATHT